MSTLIALRPLLSDKLAEAFERKQSIVYNFMNSKKKRFF